MYVRTPSANAFLARRDSLKRKHLALCEDLNRAKTERAGRAEYTRIGREIQSVQELLRDLSLQAPRRRGRTFDNYFTMCAKAALPPLEFQRIAEAATRRMAKDCETAPEGWQR